MSEKYYDQPLVVTYSGGKDSEVLVDLAFRASINFEIYNSHTTVDAPETVYHIRKQFEKWRSMGIKCTVIYPTYRGERTSMWKLIQDMKFMPTPWMRYCCKILKETTVKKRFIATGVRASESSKRKRRSAFEYQASQKGKGVNKTYDEASEVYQEDIDDSPYGECRFITAAKRHRKLVCNPIIDWSDNDIWEYIRTNGLTYNPLYDDGFDRVGCVGCPLAGHKNRERDFARFPKYEKLFRCACQKLYEQHIDEGKPITVNYKEAQNGDEIFDWWMSISK